MTEIRLCLLGAGRWGRRYIDTIANLDGVRLAVLASRNEASAGLVNGETRLFKDWREAVTAPGIDAVIVATPPAVHAHMALAALSAGRPVLIEKPLTLALREAEDIAGVSAMVSVLAMVGHTHLFNPAFRGLKRQLTSIGPIRAIRSVAGNWGPFRADVTPLWDWAPHDLAMCMDLMEGRPESVEVQSSEEHREGGYGGMYQVKLSFGHGVEADIQIGNMLQPKSRWMEVFGDESSIIVDDVRGTLTLKRGTVYRELPFSPEKPLTLLVREFADEVRQRSKSHSSLNLGIDVVRILSGVPLDGRFTPN